MCRKIGSFRARCIRGYLSYLEDRVKYLSTIPNPDSLSEIEYCKEMIAESKNWGKNHKVCYQYIMGNISSKEAMVYLGTPERSFYRIMAAQKDEFIGVLKKLEVQLMDKYGLDDRPVIS